MRSMKGESRNISAASLPNPGSISLDYHGSHEEGPPLSGESGMMPCILRTVLPRTANISSIMLQRRQPNQRRQRDDSHCQRVSALVVSLIYQGHTARSIASTA